ncbi:MAG TPA: Stk1 family PASTA domain-containing Ser/Thr kinase [Acidimicrobiia bacterium]|nr:Stk1 family PASTA domain-containing Ser/Thr kinase [Acidimicrobiia bacterium]
MTQVANIFSNRYEIKRGIARGGMAQVYLARDQLLDRPVAIKVLFPEFARDPSFVERFRREAQAAANLSHPNIVGIYDWGQERGTYFIVMEYIEGRSLRDLIHTEGPLPPAQAAEIGAEIAEALAFAHRSGVVHRDIKPGNVLMTEAGRVKVTDFGIARATQADTKEALTQTGAVMGTATYFSPEQAQGLPVDGRSDVYSLGVVLYEMLSGDPPFSGDTPVAVAYKHVREEPIALSEKNPTVPHDLERIALSAMSKDLDTRYQSADDLRDDLVRFGRGKAPSAAPVTAQVTNLPTGEGVAHTQAMPPTPDYPEEGYAPRRSSRKIAGAVVASILGVVLLAALIALITGVFTPERSSGGATVAVPDVVGQTFDEAKLALEAKGFEVEREDEESNQPENQVLEQDPAQGQKLEKGGTVTLTVSSSTVTIPNVVGKTEAQAREQLTELGFSNVVGFPEESDQAPGTVLRTEPVVGTEVKKSDQVLLVVAAEAAVDIPAVANLPQATAETNLRDAGFTVTVRPEPHDTIPAGRATRTDPAEGTKQPKGTAVTLYVSEGPMMVDVPNTVGQTQAAAQNALTTAGFNVVVSFAPSTPPNNGLVTAQSPASGQAPKGSTVTIVVGQFP